MSSLGMSMKTSPSAPGLPTTGMGGTFPRPSQSSPRAESRPSPTNSFRNRMPTDEHPAVQAARAADLMAMTHSSSRSGPVAQTSSRSYRGDAACTSRSGSGLQSPSGPSRSGSEKQIMRANTEYTKSSQQMTQIKRNMAHDPKQEKVRRSMMRLEAQKLADTFRDRVCDVLEEELDDFTVEKHGGDMNRRFLAKVRIAEGEYIHLSGWRKVTHQGWDIDYATEKDKDDPLMDDDPAYTELPTESLCNFTPVDTSCSTQ